MQLWAPTEVTSDGDCLQNVEWLLAVCSFSSVPLPYIKWLTSSTEMFED